MELVQGKVDYNQKDDQGQAISKEAAIHMSKYRIRCDACNKNFCTSCSVEPYHVGKTCEQFKEHKEARKCRYCFSKITSASASLKPAFINVCRNKECINLMNNACEKILPCGHACNGFKDEKECLPCLHEDCVDKNPQPTLEKKADDYCVICYSEGLE